MIQKVEIVHTKPAYNILECDGENLQARIAASMSREPALMDLFKNGGDFHAKNAYATMAKYTFFTPYLVSYSDGTSEEIMEWESFDLERGKHIQVKDLQEGDLVHNKKVIRVEKGTPRKISFEEYEVNAKKGRCKELRTVAKFISFGFLFGMSASAFAGSTLRIEWNPSRCQDFIDEMHLQEKQKEIAMKYRGMDETDILYLTVATFFREEFFKQYLTLEKWIPEQGQIASQQGYVRSPWGGRRLLPQLTYQGKHADGREVKNLSNIAVNSPVQNYEAVYMAKAMVGTFKDMKENGFCSYIAGTVHDSIVVFAFEEEQNEVLKIMLSHFAEKYEASGGVPYSGECNVAEVSKGFVWGYGEREVKLEEVKDVEISKRNYL